MDKILVIFIVLFDKPQAMKRNIYLLFFFSLFSCLTSAQINKQSHFRLKGIFIGKHAHVIFLTYKCASGKIEWKAYIKNGTFSFSGFISSPVFAGLTSDIKIKPNGPDVCNYVDVFLGPGKMTIVLKENDFDHAVLTGSPVQDEWIKLQTMYHPVNKIKDSLYNKLFTIERAGNTPKNHTAHVAIAKEIARYNLKIDQMDYHFISSHPKSYVSAYLLNNLIGMDMQLDSIEMFYNAFSQPVKKGIEGKAINKIIRDRKGSIVGNVVRMPLGINLNGSRFNPRTLHINNYLLLYFWTGYANDNTNLKVLYNKYQSHGLIILAISMELSKKMWRDSKKKGTY